MSILFTGERRQPAPPDPTPDMEAALVAATNHAGVLGTAVAGRIPPGRAERLIQQMRQVEPLLLTALADGSVTTKAAANQFVEANTEQPFPSVKLVQRMIDLCTPSTFAGLVAAAREELGT